MSAKSTQKGKFVVEVTGKSPSKKEGVYIGLLSRCDFCRQKRRKDISDHENGINNVGE